MSESDATGDRSARWSALRLPSHSAVSGEARLGVSPAPVVNMNLPGGCVAGEFPRLSPSLSWAGHVAVGGRAMLWGDRPSGSWSVWANTDHDRQPGETAIGPRALVRAELSPDSKDATRAFRDPFLVFAGRAWPSDQDCPAARLVGHFASLADARQAFSRVTFRRLPTVDGRERWRGAAPFGGDIVQIERRIGQPVDTP